MTPQTLSIVEHYENLSPVVAKLYSHMDQIAQTALLPLFLLSILFAYSQDLGITGAALKRLKNLFLTALLLAAFPYASEMIRTFGQELALSIDGLKGLDFALSQAALVAKAEASTASKILSLGNDLILRAFVNLSFAILFFARLGLVAFYHFYWMFLVVTAPFLILGQLFEATNSLPKNLFKNLVLVAMWPVAWSLLSVFLDAVPFTDAYHTEGGYMALIVLNLIIACAMFLSPFLLSSFCEGLMVGSGSALYSAAKTAAFIASPKVAAMSAFVGRKAVMPVAKKVMPQSAKNFAQRTRSKIESKLRNRNRPKNFYLFLLAFGIGSLSNSVWAEDIVLRPRGLSVLCLSETPQNAYLSDARFFSASVIGPKKVLLRATKTSKKSELLVLFSNGSVKSFKLVSNSILPSKTQYGCDAEVKSQLELKEEKKKTASVRVRKRKTLAKAQSKSLLAELTGVQWNSKTRDFLTLELKIKNLASSTTSPSWAGITLVSGGKSQSISKLWSERSIIAPGAQLLVRLEFKRPEISTDKIVKLVIPSRDGELTLTIPKAVLK